MNMKIPHITRMEQFNSLRNHEIIHVSDLCPLIYLGKSEFTLDLGDKSYKNKVHFGIEPKMTYFGQGISMHDIWNLEGQKINGFNGLTTGFKLITKENPEFYSYRSIIEKIGGLK